MKKKAHFSAYSIHPDSTKMYHDSKDIYWWNGNKEIHCRFCVQVFYLLTGEATTSETLQIIAEVTYSRVEVGHDCHKFCKWFSAYTEWL